MIWAQYGLSVLGILGWVVTGRKSRWGWALSTAYQVGWIPYGLVTAQYPFVAVCIVFTVVGVQNFVSWGKEPAVVDEDSR